jgi:hypothetical protein
VSGDELRRSQRRAWPRVEIAVCLLVLLSSLTACGDDDPPAATATPAPTQPPTQTPVPPAELGQIVWATAVDESTKAPQDQVSTFPRDAAAIYAVIPVTRVLGNTQITAEWDYDGVPMPELTTTVSAPDLSNGGWIEFHIARSTNLLWPAGTYRIRILVEGQLAQESTIAVQST